jgi:hypothetical protein
MRDFGKRVTKMTQQFTKEDYQVVLDRIYQLDGMTFSDHQKTDANYAECLARYSNEILSALKIAIAVQPRPIKDLRFNSSGPNWDFSDPVLFRIEYRETGIITHDVGRVMIDNVLNKAELPDNKYLEYDRITHFYDLSFLPKPQERKD